jgi:nicotinamidase/pyrazinamidase
MHDEGGCLELPRTLPLFMMQNHLSADAPHEPCEAWSATLPFGRGDALLAVDVQRDFLPTGALAVPHGDAILTPLNTALELCAERGTAVFATRDWHPPDHCSFKSRGGPWPPHCIAGTPGAEFAGGLRLGPEVHVISKGIDPELEAYSGFAGTDLERQLREAGVRRLVVGGLATDYCVLQTVLDARRLGFDVVVLRNAVAAVDARNAERALAEMAAAGAHLA